MSTPVELWTEALRSGEYMQGTGNLCKVDTDGNKEYCCLGVACEMYQKHGPGDLEVHPSSDYVDDDVMKIDNSIRYGESNSYLPYKVVAWLKPEIGDIDERQYAYVDKNDISSWSFDEIANLVEEDVKLRAS